MVLNMATKERPINDNKPVVGLRKGITARKENTNPTQGWVNKKMINELLSMGASKETTDLITSYIDREFDSDNKKDKKLSEIIFFAASIGPSTAHNYFHVISRTKAVEKLTSSEVLKFVKEIGPYAASKYFNVILQLLLYNSQYKSD